MTKLIVVVPTARSVDLNYLRPLIDDGAQFIIVNDSEQSIHIRHPNFSVYSLADRRRISGAWSELSLAAPALVAT